jgi:hypothetical protein
MAQRALAKYVCRAIIGSARRECFDHVIVFGEAGLQRLMTRYRSYPERSRTHLSLDQDTPIPRPVMPSSDNAVVAIPAVGGLHIGTSGARPDTGRDQLVVHGPAWMRAASTVLATTPSTSRRGRPSQHPTWSSPSGTRGTRYPTTSACANRHNDLTTREVSRQCTDRRPDRLLAGTANSESMKDCKLLKRRFFLAADDGCQWHEC